MNFNKKDLELLNMICSKYISVEFLGICTKNGKIIGQVFRDSNKFKIKKSELDFHALHTSFRTTSRRNLIKTFGKSEYTITKYEDFLTVTLPIQENFIMGIINKNSNQVMGILSTIKILFQDENGIVNSFRTDFRN